MKSNWTLIIYLYLLATKKLSRKKTAFQRLSHKLRSADNFKYTKCISLLLIFPRMPLNVRTKILVQSWKFGSDFMFQTFTHGGANPPIFQRARQRKQNMAKEYDQKCRQWVNASELSSYKKEKLYNKDHIGLLWNENASNVLRLFIRWDTISHPLLHFHVQLQLCMHACMHVRMFCVYVCTLHVKWQNAP